jgi:hypothetical protein
MELNILNNFFKTPPFNHMLIYIYIKIKKKKEKEKERGIRGGFAWNTKNEGVGRESRVE